MKSRKPGAPLEPVKKNTLLYSVIILAHNEERNVVRTLTELTAKLRDEHIPFELVVVNDNSTDRTVEVVEEQRETIPEIWLVHNRPPRGLGRAVRCGLQHFNGDVVAIVMADSSDDPDDVVRCYRKIEEGYDAIFGSRFTKESTVTAYPPVKLIVNRLVNRMMQLMFMTRFNDLTNAFKVYRSYVIESIKPLYASHFNITIEMSLSTLIREYRIAQIPISWSGRTWGQSNLKLKEMGRRYMCTLLKVWFERLLIQDDLMAEKVEIGEHK